ncbi:MAG: WD40 repeat domain-containing protein [Pseudonocardiaceae bacterium]
MTGGMPGNSHHLEPDINAIPFVDTQPRQLGPPLAGHTGPVTAMVLRTLVVGSHDGTAIVWDLTDPVQPQRLGPPLTGHSDTVWSVAFAPDGRTLATVSYDGTAIVWDVTDRAQPRRLDPPLSREPVAVWSVALSPDGRTLAIGSIATTLWDVTAPDSPRRLGPLLHSGSLQAPSAVSLAFSADGRTLAVGTNDGTVELWDLAALHQLRDHAVQRACAITHGGLDRDEWHSRIPNLPHQNSCPP